MNISNVPAEGTCTGCRACEQVCNKHAIEFVYNEYGFLIPVVNGSCTQCGNCVQVCHACEDNKIFNKISTCYIAYAKNKKSVKLSASGGAFFVIATKMIEELNGTVYGCCMDDDFNVFHSKTSDINELKKYQGSKYVQSNTRDTYSSVKEDLENGKVVLYTGTPCQIAGLKSFLRKEWENLYTADLICHGVPSQDSFKKYIKWLEHVSGQKILNFRFRNRNAFDASGYLIKVAYENGKVKKCAALDDLYFRLFSTNKSLNSVCYKCKYAQAERVGDITIGDSAAAGAMGVYRYDAKSTIMINSQKGKDIWNLIKDDLVYTEIDKENEIKRNKPLTVSSPCSEERDNICRLMVECKFNEISDLCPQERISTSRLQKVSAKMPLTIKKMLYFCWQNSRKIRSKRK